jgi:hypothetical protein
LFRTDKHFNIHDNSDSATYFNAHHMEVRAGNQVKFSFWDNDADKYNLYYCKGLDWSETTKLMDGYYDGGDRATVGLIVNGNNGSYSLEARQVDNDV